MVLNVNNVTGGYSKTPIIHDVTFGVARGQITGLIGLNGAGKSTTIKHILGLLTPHAGSIEVSGLKIEDDVELYRKNVAYIPETPILYEELTLKEHIFMTAMAYGISEREALSRAAELLTIFRLDGKLDMFPTHFSKGMKQKVMLVCAFMVEPDLYIIDEPFLGLDPLGIEALIQLLIRERDQGRSILMSTHILATAERYCDKYTIIHDGRIVEDGTIEHLREKLNMPNATLDELYIHITGSHQYE